MPARHTRRLARTTAGALAVIAIAAPTAGARPALEPSGNTSAGSAGVIEYENAAPAPIVTTIDEGFQWGTAAIGAGGAAVVLLLTAAGATTLTRRHHHHNVGALR